MLNFTQDAGFMKNFIHLDKCEMPCFSSTDNLDGYAVSHFNSSDSNFDRKYQTTHHFYIISYLLNSPFQLFGPDLRHGS